MTISDTFPGWGDYLAILARAEQVLSRLPDQADPQIRQEAFRLLFATIATGYQSAFADPDMPDFVPAVSSLLNTVGVNPDFIYGYAKIDGTGTYRLTGYRGDGVFVLLDFIAGGLGVLDELGPSVGTLDLDKCTIGPDGRFDVLLSSTRPDGHEGDWFELDARVRTISLRRAYYHWGEGQDCKIAIERVDCPLGGGRLSTEEVARRLTGLCEFVERYVTFALSYNERHLKQGYVNRLEYDDWAGRGGVAGQHYYQGIFQLRDGEAMIVETELPDRVRYWNIQVNDPMWNTIDWINHQSSLNGGQARLDSDGKFRAVISPQDPGIPNWLDTAGRTEGSLMLRWTEASSGPEPQLKIVPINEVREHLPADTPVLTPEERQQSLIRRRRGAQMRTRW